MISILESINQVVSNLVRTFDLKNNYLDEDESWSGILSATDFIVRSTYNATLQSMPGQLVFIRDIILNTHSIADWGSNRRHEQQIIDKNKNNKN